MLEYMSWSVKSMALTLGMLFYPVVDWIMTIIARSITVCGLVIRYGLDAIWRAMFKDYSE